MPTSAPPVRSEDEYPKGPVQGHSHATVALVVGIVGMFIFGIILGPIAVVMGMRARKDIDASNGRMTGRGQATAAVVIGSVSVVLWAVILISAIVGS